MVPDSVADPLVLYFRDVGRTPLLTPEQERALARRARAGDLAARDGLLRANLRLVAANARHFQGRGLGLDDLIAEGNFGLFRAVEKFDPERGIKFSTYATYWIRQYLGAAVKEKTRTIRLPAYVMELITKAGKAKRRGVVCVLPKKLEKILGAALQVLETYSLQDLGQNKLNGWVGTVTGDDVLVDRQQPAPDQLLVDQELRDRLRDRLEKALELLDDRERDILGARFGLGGGEPEKLQEIGDRLGLTRERIRQIEAQALGKLRAAMGG